MTEDAACLGPESGDPDGVRGPADGAGGSGLPGLARGSSINLVGSAVMALTTFGLTVAVTRQLGKATAGMFFSATSAFLLVTSIGMLGTNTALVYFISRSKSLGTTERIIPYARVALRAVVLVAVLVSAALVLSAERIAAVLGAADPASTAGLIRGIAVFAPLAGLENVLVAATRGLGIMRVGVVVDQIFRGAVQLVLVLVALVTAPVVGLGLAWALPYLPAAWWAWVWWRRLTAALPTHLPAAELSGLRREFWRFSGPRAFAAVGQMAMQRLDIPLVGALSGLAQAAIYTAATRFVVVGQMVNRAISTAVQPRLAFALARDDRAQARQLYGVSTAWLMVLTWPIFLFCLHNASWILTVFGHGYEAGRDVLLVMSCAVLFAMGCGMVDVTLNMAGKSSWNLANTILALVVNLTLDLLLIPRLGPTGAAIGWAAAIGTSNTVALSQIALSMGLHPFGRATTAAAASALFSFGAVPLLVSAVTPGVMLWAVVVPFLTYAGCLVMLRGPLELGALLGAFRGRRGRGRPGGGRSPSDGPSLDC